MSRWRRASSLVAGRPDTTGGRVLRWIVLVIFVAGAILTASIVVHRARLTETTAATLVTQQAQTARNAVRLFFPPVVSQLVVVRALGRQGLFGASQMDRFKNVLIPLLEPLEQVGACTVIAPDRQWLTLRWNLKADKAGPEIERAWLKTLVAFLNTDGGTLLIGVRDDGEILGLETDRFPNEDKFLLHFNNLIKQQVGLEQVALISVAIRSMDDKRICVVDCDRSTEPVFLRKGDQEEFFVRIGSGTRHLPASKVLEYVKKRSPN